MTPTASFMITLGDAAIKATLLLGAAALLAALLRPASAAARHLVWSLGLAGALCLPLLTRTMPRLDLALPRFHRAQARTAVVPPPSAGRGAATPGAGDGSGAVIAPHVSATALTQSYWPACVLLAWLAGVGLSLMRLLSGMASVRKIARESGPIEFGPLAASAAAACRALAVRRQVDFRCGSGHVPVPMGWGWLRSTVVLPAGATDWPPERMNAALLHELAHVKRQDWPVQILTEIVCALYWFHPLVWLAARQSRRESEHACDDLVLGAGMAPADYAGHLLSVVRSARAFGAAPVTAVTMGHPSALNRRVSAILAPHPRRQGRTPRMAAAAVAAAMIVACPLAALRPVGAAGPVSSELRGVVVVVDAGHGGMDTGGVSQSGVTEKALDLMIARRLRAEMEQRGAQVFMTRDGDTFPSLESRPRFASAKRADYFISVHCDSILNGPVGAVVLYHDRAALGHRLAADVGQSMRLRTRGPGAVISDATRFHTGFRVLREATMPAVLVECGSMTDAGDLARLQTAEGQQRIAEGIAAGLGAFRKSTVPAGN